jgi:hypothetical protein
MAKGLRMCGTCAHQHSKRKRGEDKGRDEDKESGEDLESDEGAESGEVAAEDIDVGEHDKTVQRLEGIIMRPESEDSEDDEDSSEEVSSPAKKTRHE